MKYKLHFINQNIIWEVKGGSIADACTEAGICLPKPCGGFGTCGKCQVSIRRGMDKKPSGEKELEKVLACRTMVDEDMEIYVTADIDAERPSTSLFAEEKTAADIPFHPSVRKVFHPADEHPKEAGALLKEQLSMEVMRTYSLKRSAPGYEGSTFVYYNEKLIDIQEGNTTDMIYGAAIDIGTTTVALYIYDLKTGDLLAVKSAWNGQAMYGADVIARINYAAQSEERLEDMQKKIMETIRQMILQSGLTKRQMENLYHITVCGNSAMQHLFFGWNPAALGVNPFVSVCQQSVCFSAKDLFLSIADKMSEKNAAAAMIPDSDAASDLAVTSMESMPVPEQGVVEFLPLLGGFVGADTTAVLLNLPKNHGNENEDNTYLVVDLGTNGEIALGNHEKGFLVASTACGPALEGGNISCGMRAEPGAIDQIRLVEGELHLHWIGKDESCKPVNMESGKRSDPTGLCGSGLVDAIMVLLELGIIDSSGRMLTPEEYLEQYRQPPSDYKSLQVFRKKRKFARYIRNLEPDNPVFCFSTGEKPVYLSQKDIRQFQLAKSAIYAGCMALLSEAGITPEDMDNQIDGLVLSGAFGNYINLEHAMILGLLPQIPRSKVFSIGNGAGTGVCKLLLQSSFREKADFIAENARHVALAAHPVFVEKYVANMDLKPEKNIKNQDKIQLI